MSQDPQQALRQYAAAVAADDPQKAYDILAAEEKKNISFKEFSSRWKRYPGELQAQARALSEKLAKPASLRATVSLSEDTEVRLVWRDQSWQLENGIGIFLQTNTPQATVRSLIRAVEEMNFQNIYMLLAKERRQALQEELQKRLERLPRALDKIEITGNRARLEFGPSYSLELVKEGGQWRILEVN